MEFRFRATAIVHVVYRVENLISLILVVATIVAIFAIVFTAAAIPPRNVAVAGKYFVKNAAATELAVNNFRNETLARMFRTAEECSFARRNMFLQELLLFIGA